MTTEQQNVDLQDYPDKPHDQMLNYFLTAIEEHPDNRADMTLIISGSLVQGTVVPYATWKTGWLDQIERAGVKVDSARESLGRADRADAETYERLLEADRPVPALGFIHMVNVRFMSRFEQEYPLWRFTLRSVDGWACMRIDTSARAS